MHRGGLSELTPRVHGMPRGHVPKWHLNGAVVDSLPQGTEVHVTGKVLGTDWYKCELDGKTVYMSDDWLDPELQQVMACTVDALNIRTGASTNYPVVGTLRRGDKVKISAMENDWLKFSPADGSIVYVADDFLAAVY